MTSSIHAFVQHLGTVIDYLLDDSNDIRICINKANKAMGALSFIWNSLNVQIDSKIKLYLDVPVNLALWNGERWSGSQADLAALDLFHHESISRKLVIRMKRVMKEHMKNF